MNEALTLWLMAPEAHDGPLTLEDFLRRPEWQAEARCSGQGPALFVRAPKADYGRLRAVCSACPVRRECLSFALADDSLIGLWGGTTDAERRELAPFAGGVNLATEPRGGIEVRVATPPPRHRGAGGINDYGP